MKPTPEQFEAWRANPVTEWLLDTFVAAEMRRTRETFQDAAWDADPRSFDFARQQAFHLERYQTLDWLRSLDMETIEQTLEMQE
jgi:hypothetical protein